MLYGRKCCAPICWDQVGERVVEGPEMIEVTNAKVVVAKEKLKEARTRQKCYASKHRRELEFQTALPPQLSHVHDVFHVCLLRGYKYHPLHVITSTLNHLMCIPFADVAQVANAARNYEILHERDDDGAERPDKR
nr:putative nucleotidyltransferase, ribonuclease H [Tanacetum cinerariifolium]